MENRAKISMVDITEKPDVVRIAKAEGVITLKEQTVRAIREKRIKKGDVLTAAKLAAIHATKKTPDLVLLAHPIPITSVETSIELDEAQSTVKLVTEVHSIGKTGVELEAIMGVMAGLLTVFDMCKYLEKDAQGQYDVTEISDITVVEKIKESP
jgi:cyclic pyranopterin phosphate synthase